MLEIVILTSFLLGVMLVKRNKKTNILTKYLAINWKQRAGKITNLCFIITRCHGTKMSFIKQETLSNNGRKILRKSQD